MPITYRVDHENRIVVARGYGTFTDEDVFGYQRQVWSRSEVAGYDELVDMTLVTKIALPSVQRVQDLASVSAQMDQASAPSRFAVVAPDDLAYGLGRMYQAYRESERGSRKTVSVFRTLAEALRFLDADPSLALPPLPPGVEVGGR